MAHVMLMMSNCTVTSYCCSYVPYTTVQSPVIVVVMYHINGYCIAVKLNLLCVCVINKKEVIEV